VVGLEAGFDRKIWWLWWGIRWLVGWIDGGDVLPCLVCHTDGFGCGVLKDDPTYG